MVDVNPFEVTFTVCLACGRALKIPAGRRRREIRLGLKFADFCSTKCNKDFVAREGKKAQDKKQ